MSFTGQRRRKATRFAGSILPCDPISRMLLVAGAACHPCDWEYREQSIRPMSGSNLRRALARSGAHRCWRVGRTAMQLSRAMSARGAYWKPGTSRPSDASRRLPKRHNPLRYHQDYTRHSHAMRAMSHDFDSCNRAIHLFGIPIVKRFVGVLGRPQPGKGSRLQWVCGTERRSQALTKG